MSESTASPSWLVLVYQFPKGPDARRVKVWRRLQAIGAVAIKHSVYVLPCNDQSREDFAWLLNELEGVGADGVILETRIVDGMSDAQVRKLFSAARNDDYDALAAETEKAMAQWPKSLAPDDVDLRQAARRTLQRARKRMADIKAIDFFAADGRAAAAAALRTLEERLDEHRPTVTPGEQSMKRAALEELNHRVWVTRRGVRVDRIASAWLIRRWIDPDARFKFVARTGYGPAEDEIRFDMFEAEFTHEGDRCTFEVLAGLARPDDRALRIVGEIVHDIDLKDEKFARPETAGVAIVLDGIVSATEDDERRIERGSALFEDLYRSFREKNA